MLSVRCFSLGLFFFICFDLLVFQELTTIKSPPIRGALVDEYNSQFMIVKIKSPSDVLEDVIKRLDKDRIDPKLYTAIAKPLGNIEVHFQKQFNKLL